MKYILIIILCLFSSLSQAGVDDFRITPGLESFSLKSSDKSNQGDINLYSLINPNLKFQYNHAFSRNNKLTIIYKAQYLNFGNNTIDTKGTVLSNLFIGQTFYTHTSSFFYYLGDQEKYFIYSQSSRLEIAKTFMPSFTLGFNHNLFELDQHIVGIGGRGSYIYAGNKEMNGFKINDGSEFSGGLTFTRFLTKSFFYRVYVEAGIENQNTSNTTNVIQKNAIGVDFNFKF